MNNFVTVDSYCHIFSLFLETLFCKMMRSFASVTVMYCKRHWRSFKKIESAFFVTFKKSISYLLDLQCLSVYMNQTFLPICYLSKYSSTLQSWSIVNKDIFFKYVCIRFYALIFMTLNNIWKHRFPALLQNFIWNGRKLNYNMYF